MMPGAAGRASAAAKVTDRISVMRSGVGGEAAKTNRRMLV
mgnify:CR=1 FL=1